MRDIDTDRRSGKRTLAVRLGRERTRILYATMLAAAYLTAPVTWLFGPLFALAVARLAERAPLAISIVMIVGARTDGPWLNGATGSVSSKIENPSSEPNKLVIASLLSLFFLPDLVLHLI